MADAVFTEVLEVQVDVDAFKQGLIALESAYEDFVERINEKGFGAGSVLQVGAFSALEGQIGQLSQQMLAFDAEVSNAMADLDTGLKRVQEGIGATGQAAVDAKAKIAQEQATATAGGGGGIGIGNASSILGGASDFFGGISRSVATMNGGLLGMLGYMAALRAAWQLVGTAINAVTEVIKAPFEIVKTGFEYLSRLQDQAASLQGPIAANVKFSEDLGKNFKIAGDAAKVTAQSLQEMAISLGVPVEQLQKEFIDVLESGGMHFVQSLQGALNLTKELNIAVMATSTSAEGQRKAMNEIPKLLEGQLSGQSRVLTTLHLTNEEWMAIREEGLRHQDLELRLAELLKPYLSVVEQAHTRQTALVNMIELQAQKMAGAVALPLWQVFVGLLQKAQEFLAANGAAIQQNGENLVSTVAEMGRFVLEIEQVILGTGNLKTLFGAVLTTINNLTGALRITIATLATMGREAGTVFQFLGDPLNFFSKKAIDDLNNRIDTFEQQYKQKIAQIYKDGDVAAQRAFSTTYGDQSILTQGTASGPYVDTAAIKTATAAIKQFQEGYREQIAETKEKYKELDDALKAQGESGLLSAKSVTEKRIALKRSEVAEIEGIISGTQQKLLTQETAIAALKKGVDSQAAKDFAAQADKTKAVQEDLNQQAKAGTLAGQALIDARAKATKDAEFEVQHLIAVYKDLNAEIKSTFTADGSQEKLVSQETAIAALKKGIESQQSKDFAEQAARTKAVQDDLTAKANAGTLSGQALLDARAKAAKDAQAEIKLLTDSYKNLNTTIQSTFTTAGGAAGAQDKLISQEAALAALKKQQATDFAAQAERTKKVQDDLTEKANAGTLAGQALVTARAKASKDAELEVKSLTDRYKDLNGQIETSFTTASGSNFVTKFSSELALDSQKNSRTGGEDERKLQLEQNEADFRVTQQNFRNELETSHKTFAAVEADIKDRLETGNISFHQATQERVQAIDNQLLAIQTLVQEYTKLATASGAKPADVNKFKADLTQISSTAQIAATTGVSGAKAADTAEEERITQAHLDRLRQMELAHSRAMLDIYKQETSVGLHTKAELFDQERSLSDTEHRAVISNLVQELVAVGNNEKERARIQDMMAAEDRRYTDSISQDSRTRAAIVASEAAQFERDSKKEQALRVQITQLQKQNALGTGALAGQIVQSNLKIAKADLDAAVAALAYAKAQLAAAAAAGVKGDALEKLVIQELEAEKAVEEAQGKVNSDKSQTDGAQITQEIFGKGVADLHDAFDGFGRTVESMGNAFKFFSDAASSLISGIKSGYQSGGVMGGIGAAASQIGGMIPGPVGAIISGVGSMFSFLGGLFTAAAKRIAADIKKSVDALMQQYSNGQTTLIATLGQLQAERQDAINRLSGQKGGQSQLDNLLPQIDQQIASLEAAQRQIFDSFEKNLAVLQTQSSTIGAILAQWQQINKQVQDYINAGGDAAKASEFISLSLAQQQQTAQASLNDAEGQAIQDAMQLNDLLTQRVNLAKQFAEQEFSIKNQDALERMANPAINAAITFQQQKQANDAQLVALDQQITLYTARVAMERQVFDLASTTADLQAKANELNLDALQKTIDGWLDLKSVIASIFQNADGSFGINSNLFNPQTSAPVSNHIISVGGITITVNGTDANAVTIAQQLYNELSLLGRFGADPSYA